MKSSSVAMSIFTLTFREYLIYATHEYWIIWPKALSRYDGVTHSTSKLPKITQHYFGKDGSPQNIAYIL